MKHRISQPTTRRMLFLLALVIPIILACTSVPTTMTTGETVSWACPSPTPKPYGTSGPIKEVIERELPTAVPSGPRRTQEEYVYYEEWEQEYGSMADSPPFPSPTPYVLVGTTYRFGQRVRVPPLFVLVDAQGGPLTGDGRQLYQVTVTWFNPTTQAVAVDHAIQVTLRAITTPEDREVTNSWRTSVEASELSGISSVSRTIPPGESSVVVPILAPLVNPRPWMSLSSGVPPTHRTTP